MSTGQMAALRSTKILPLFHCADSVPLERIDHSCLFCLLFIQVDILAADKMGICLTTYT